MNSRPHAEEAKGAKKSAMVEIVRRLRRIFWKEINCGIHGTRGRRTGRKSFFRVFRLFRGQSFLPSVAALSLCGPCVLCGWPSALSRLNQRHRTVKISAVDLQPLTSIQQNNFTSQPAPSRTPITLTVCATICPSTTSRQHYFHRTAPLYMRGAIIFCSLLRSW